MCEDLFLQSLVILYMSDLYPGNPQTSKKHFFSHAYVAVEPHILDMT